MSWFYEAYLSTLFEFKQYLSLNSNLNASIKTVKLNKQSN